MEPSPSRWDAVVRVGGCLGPAWPYPAHHYHQQVKQHIPLRLHAARRPSHVQTGESSVGCGETHHPPVITPLFAPQSGLAQMLKGGVIMDVVTAEEARIAEEAGAVAVMALERVPADIRKDGGVARMSDPDMIRSIKAAVTIPVMAKARIGHFVEAQILEALGVDYIDESEVLTPADDIHHISKHNFKVPFVCGCRDLGEALRRIAEGAAMIRTKVGGGRNGGWWEGWEGLRIDSPVEACHESWVPEGSRGSG